MLDKSEQQSLTSDLTVDLTVEPTGITDRKFLPKRNLRLDGIRGLAILLIMQVHFLKFPEEGGIGRFLYLLSSAGWVGVDLFFVLSGFLITGILIDSKSKPNFFKNFYARRTLRIFPVYYLYLGLYFIFVIQLKVINFDPARTLDAVQEFPWVTFYGTNIIIALKNHYITSSLTHFWSLAIEEHFYLLFPAVVYFCNAAQLKRCCWFGIGTAIGLRTALVLTLGSVYGISVLTPCRMDSFLVGGLCAILMTNHHSPLMLKQRSQWALILCSVIMLAIIGHYGGLNGGDPWIQSIGYTILAVLFAAMLIRILVSAPNSPQVKLFEADWLRFLGKYSYGIYIFHHPLNIALERVLPTAKFANLPGSWFTATLIHSAIASVLSIIVALLSWHLLEKHFLKLKDKFSSGHGSV